MNFFGGCCCEIMEKLFLPQLCEFQQQFLCSRIGKLHYSLCALPSSLNGRYHTFSKAFVYHLVASIEGGIVVTCRE